VTVWRLHIRPDATRATNPVQFCLERSVIGIGWRVDPSPDSRDEYFERGQVAYQGSKGWKQAANAIVDGMKQDDLVWFRDYSGNYYLARVSGEWKYEDSDDYLKADIVNVRPVQYFEVGKRVPGKIESSFAPRATLQRISGTEAALYSMVVFNRQSNADWYAEAGVAKSKHLFELLTPTEYEDAVGLYLQIRHEYIMIPSSRMRNDNTICYEYELVSPKKGNRVLVQVKSGSVPLAIQDYVRMGGEWWLFTTGGYIGQPTETVHIIQPSELEDFIRRNQSLMPETIRYWLEYQDGR
jgi:hypothetical protein